MSAPPEIDDGDRGVDDGERWADIVLETGEVVIYDTDNHTAWVQSDTAVARDAAT